MMESTFKSQCPNCRNIDMLTDSETKRTVHCQICYHHYEYKRVLDEEFDSRLDEIKYLHNEANDAYQRAMDTGSCADEDVVTDNLAKLFYEEHTDWLIEQAEQTELIRKLIKGRWSTDTITVNQLWHIMNT